MNERELFKKTFDSVTVPAGLAERAAARTQPVRRVPGSALRTLVVAALLAALLTAGVTGGFLGDKRDFVQLCNAELDELRELGLFHTEFELTEKDLLRRKNPEPGAYKGEYVGEVVMYGGGDTVYCSLFMNADIGKIIGMTLVARPQKDWEGEPSHDSEGNPMYVYDNYEAIIDTDMTIGQYCDIWAQYRGYDRYELPEGVDAETRYLEANTLDAWDFTFEGTGICIPFYRAGEDEPGYAWISYEPTGSGPSIAFGDASLKG